MPCLLVGQLKFTNVSEILVSQSLDQVLVAVKMIKTIDQHKWHVDDVGLIVLHICATIQMWLYKFFCLRWFLNTQAALFVLPYVVKKIRGFCMGNCMVLLYCHRLWNIIEGHNTNYQEYWENLGAENMYNIVKVYQVVFSEPPRSM